MGHIPISIHILLAQWPSTKKLEELSIFLPESFSPLFRHGPGGISYVLRKSLPHSSEAPYYWPLRTIYFLTTIHRLLLPGPVPSALCALPHL